MNSAFVLLTDERGLALTQQAVAMGVLTQKTTKKFIIFCAGFMPDPNSRLVTAARKKGVVVEFRPISSKPCDGVQFRTGDNRHNHVTPTAILKIHAIDSLSTEFDRVMYMDNDVLLMQDINIEKIDFEGFPIAAAYDIAKVGDIDHKSFHERCADKGRSPHYFNAGVIVSECKQWKHEFIHRYVHFLKLHKENCDYQEDCSCRDQCVWNLAFERNWKRLPLFMNLQACAMFSRRWKHAAVRHRCGKAKFIPYRPWRSDWREISLVNKGRKLLGEPTFGFTWLCFLFSFNAWRLRLLTHRKWIREVEEAADKADSLSCKTMDD